MRFLGIDPGKDGGIAIVDEAGRAVRTWKMPATQQELLDLLRDAAKDDELRGMVEQLGHMPRRDQLVRCPHCHGTWTESKPCQSPTTMFKMGTNYGGVHMALAAASIPYDEVLPRTWQAEFGLLKGGRKYTSTEKKNMHKTKAERLFPTVKVTHYVADALLIAAYCWRTHCLQRPF